MNNAKRRLLFSIFTSVSVYDVRYTTYKYYTQKKNKQQKEKEPCHWILTRYFYDVWWR